MAMALWATAGHRLRRRLVGHPRGAGGAVQAALLGHREAECVVIEICEGSYLSSIKLKILSVLAASYTYVHVGL